ncbi:MAG: tetratricopeptide repeat protein [Phycisphaerae bacterium]
MSTLSELQSASTARACLRFAPLLVVLAGTLVYLNSLGNAFVFDDFSSIVHNEHLRSLLPLSQSLTAPAGTGASGRPVVAFSLALNYAIGGLDAVGFHAFNLIVHVATGLLLYGLLRRTLGLALQQPHAAGRASPAAPASGSFASAFAAPPAGPALDPAISAAVLALVASLLWIVHPLHTNTLNHVVYRNEMLAACFYLLTLYALLRGATGGGAGAYVVAIVACALGMGSKEVMVSAPIVALAFDRLFLAPSWSELLRRRRWVHLALFATWGVLWASMLSGHRGTTVGFEREVTPVQYALTQLGVVAHYLRLSVWPAPLVLDAHDWPIARSLTQLGAAALVVPAFLVLTVWQLIRNPRVGFPLAAFFAILAPTSSFIPLTGAVVGTHRMYLPLAIAITLIVLAAWSALRSAGPRAALGAIAGVATLLAFAFGAITMLRNPVFASERTLWRDVVEKRPDNIRARFNLGVAALEVGDVDEALPHLERAARALPDNPVIRSHYGSALARAGRTAEAADLLAAVVAANPSDFGATNSLARVRLQQGRFREAADLLRRLADALPNDGAVHADLGRALLAGGDLDDAARALETARRLDPTNPWVYATAGLLALQQRDIDAARDQLLQAVERAPRDPDILLACGAALAGAERMADAAPILKRFVALRPDAIPILCQLAAVLATSSDAQVRDPAEAVRLAERAVQLTAARQPVPLDTLGIAYASAGRFDDAIRATERALQIVRQIGNAEMATPIEERLAGYREQRPYVPRAATQPKAP